MLAQFKHTIKDALASQRDERALLRARSALQRFSVVEWVEDLETLQTKSILAHLNPNKGFSAMINSGFASLTSSRRSTPVTTAANTPLGTAPNSAGPSRVNSVVASPAWTPIQSRTGSRVNSPTHSPVQSRAPSPVPEDGEPNRASSSRVVLSVPPRRGNHLKHVSSSRNVVRNGSFASLHAAIESTLSGDDTSPNEAIPENEEDHSHDTVSPRSSGENYSRLSEYGLPNSLDRRLNSYSRNSSAPGSPIASPPVSRPSTPPRVLDGRQFDVNRSRSLLVGTLRLIYSSFLPTKICPHSFSLNRANSLNEYDRGSRTLRLAQTQHLQLSNQLLFREEILLTKIFCRVMKTWAKRPTPISNKSNLSSPIQTMSIATSLNA